MKKNLNKLATLALTGILMTGMSFGALAEENSQTEAADSTNKVAATGIADGGASVVFGKKIIFEDLSNDKATADVPDAVYTYTIAAGAKGTTSAKQSVNGKEQNVIMQVEAGNENAVIHGKEATLQFGVSDKDIKTDTAGAYAVEKPVQFDFDAAAFDHAGIYRYEITEIAADSNPTTIQKNSGYSSKRVLDVWVTNKADGTGLEISNYTLYKWEDNRTSYNSDTKGPGWTDGQGSEYKDESKNSENLEKFVTSDLKVEKKITGTLANKKQKFAFTVSLDPVAEGGKENSYVGMQVVADVNGTKSVETVSDENTVTVTGELTDGGTIIIYGLPSDVKYTVSEVDATKNGYEASAKTTTFNGELPGGQEVKLGTSTDKDGNVTSKLAGEEKIDGAGAYVQVTNELRTTTPTGVVKNIAPYAAMILGAGAFAGVFLGRKKSEDEE